MDRISALRNVEETLSELDAGEVSLATAEERVVGVLRSYVTEFEDEAATAYRAVGAGPADGMVVVAADRTEARERVRALADGDPGDLEFERLG